MNRRGAAFALCAAVGGALALHADAQRSERPRYAQALEAELAAMGLDPDCTTSSPTRTVCDYQARSSESERNLPAHAVYSDASDTVYFYVERYLVAPPQAPATPVLLRRLMELNWSLLVGKFEWNPENGEVRLGAVLHTDSNFDRRAFRSIVLALDTTAARYLAELGALQHGAGAP